MVIRLERVDNMEEKELLDLLNKNLNGEYIIELSQLKALIVDISRVNDKKFTDAINDLKTAFKLKINATEKERIRLFFAGYPIEDIDPRFANFNPGITEDEYSLAMELISEGFSRNESTMIESLLARYRKNVLNHGAEYVSEYIDYLKEIQGDNEQLVVLNINGSDNLTTNEITSIIADNYENLSNYHYMIVAFNDDKNIISWRTISEVAIYMENFKLEKDFNVFNKKNRPRRIEEITNFYANNEFINDDIALKEASSTFYDGVAYGFQFEDTFISKDGRKKILVMQKVELDETPKLCPSCLTEQSRGNSYPRILYKSFECQNPACPSRSKIGRGKRFDLFGAKRQIMLERNSEQDQIADVLYSSYRRDIIDENNSNLESFISLYSWDGDSVLAININNDVRQVYRGRNVNYLSIADSLNRAKRKVYITYNELPIVKLFTTLSERIIFHEDVHFEKQEYDGNLFIHGNSSQLMQAISSENLGVIGSAVTSPPYYNAREYSQWPNMICYFMDMMVNATSAYNALKEDAIYIYNIGDIVGQDNVYINSNMSKRRQMLGFYSVMIFNLVGFSINTNIIWDKGEVQSKRNSTSNHISGYIKPVNSYEHDFVFIKGKELLQPTEVRRIETVKKINSKGENILGHTAPYPIEIAELIIPYSDPKELIMDPFLGSGTTLVAAYKNGFNGIGFEMNDTYYQLAINRYLQDSVTSLV